MSTDPVEAADDGWDDALADPLAVEEGTAEPFYDSLPSFVHQFLLPNWRRQLGRGQWCRVWWEHSEAILRLEALWDAFESLRLEPGTGTSVFLRDHLDPHMRSLTDRETTPFYKCDPDKDLHQVPDVLPTLAPPAGMFLGTEPETD